MWRRYRATMIVGALLCGARFAHAQWHAAVDLGAARLNEPDLAASGVTTIGAALGWTGRLGTVAFDGVSARGLNGNGTGQATGSVSLLTPAFHRSLIELSAIGTAFGATNQLPVTSLELSVKQYYGRQSVGVFYGVGAGRSAWAGASLPAATAEAGAWWHHDADQFSLVVDGTMTQSEFRTAVSTGEERTVFDVRYVDAGLHWQRSLDRATITAMVGTRLGIDDVDAHSAWVATSAVYTLLSQLAVVAGAGQAPPDFVRGVPESRYFSLSMRIGGGQRTGVHPGLGPVHGPTLSVEGGGDHHLVRVRAAGASRVELMADFTEWQPVPLIVGQGDWTIEHPMSPGLHRVLIRLDGGAWMVPANLTRGHDDFGNPVGLITVL